MQAHLPAALVQNLIEVLQTCRHNKDLEQVKRLHAHFRQRGLDLHPVLGNFLIPALVDCGSMADAQQAFHSLPSPNKHSWTSLMLGYLHSGSPQRAFHLYHQMQGQHCAQPDESTFLALLSACARLKDSEKGWGLHADIVKWGLESDLYVGSTIVDMYTKCSFLAEAEAVLDRLPGRNVVSWNALIAGYVEHGFSKEAKKCFQQMQMEGVSPDAITFTCNLKACGTIGALETGRALYSEVVTRGLENDLHVSNTLVDMYTKCSSFAEAQHLFDLLPVRNTVSWNALIAGYAEHELGKEARKCLHLMQLEDVVPDSVTYVCSLKACRFVGDLEIGQEIHGETIKKGFDRELYVGSTLVDMYGRCCSFEEAHHVLYGLPVRNVVTWNGLIAGCAQHALAQEAGKCLQQMECEGILPNYVTYVCSLKACASAGALEIGHVIHAAVTARGLETELYVGNTLVDMYAKCGSLPEAQRVFDKLPIRDAVSWAALIAGYAEHKFDEEVLTCFKQMQLAAVSLDAVTYIVCLKACATLGALEIGREVHTEIRKSGLERDPFVGGMLVEMYGKCGSVTEGREVFDRSPFQDVIMWTALIKAYGENHDAHMAIQCFENMQELGVKPDSVAFACLLAACSHASLVLRGQEYFKIMREKHEIKPTIEHYSCMVDLLARSGHVYEAERFITTMDCPPSSVILMALLSASKIYGKVELGERCFQLLVEANEEDASAYLLMADMYENAGRWSDASRIEEARKCIKAKKKPGSALMEVNKTLIEFLVDADQNDYISNFYNLRLKVGGYVPNIVLDCDIEPEIQSNRALLSTENTFIV